MIIKEENIFEADSYGRVSVVCLRAVPCRAVPCRAVSCRVVVFFCVIPCLSYYSCLVIPPRFQVVRQLEMDCLLDIRVDRTPDAQPMVRLKFDYIRKERQSRDYVMENEEDCQVPCLLVGQCYVLEDRLQVSSNLTFCAIYRVELL